MAEAKQFKVVAVESVKEGTKHRVQLEIHQLQRRRIVETIADKQTTSYPLRFYTVYIKNVLLDGVAAATVQTAARALMTEFKAIASPKPSAGFTTYEEEFDRT